MVVYMLVLTESFVNELQRCGQLHAKVLSLLIKDKTCRI